MRGQAMTKSGITVNPYSVPSTGLHPMFLLRFMVLPNGDNMSVYVLNCSRKKVLRQGCHMHLFHRTKDWMVPSIIEIFSMYHSNFNLHAVNKRFNTLWLVPSSSIWFFSWNIYASFTHGRIEVRLFPCFICSSFTNFENYMKMNSSLT